MLDQTPIPFNKPYITGDEINYVQDVCERGIISGDGFYTKKASLSLEKVCQSSKILLTPSCTAALEMTALLLNIMPGDEVIMPSFTFVSTANAFALRGAKIIFCDIDADTLNINPSLIKILITSKTKAIVPVHYAGNSCDMDAIMNYSTDSISIIEDAAQGIFATYKDKPLGSIGRLGAISFHETKNISCGEGGALLVNDPNLVERAEHIREKGTNRSSFFRGESDKYTWVDIGSSFLLGDMSAAFLLAQIQNGAEITQKRLSMWDFYFKSLSHLEFCGKITLPKLTIGASHNAHMFYFLANTAKERGEFLEFSRNQKVQSIFHYVPLHNAPASSKYSEARHELPITEALSSRLVRLPMWIGVNQNRVLEVVNSFYSS